MIRRYNVRNLQRLEKVFNKLKKFLPESYHEIQLALCPTKAKSYNTYQGGYAVYSTIIIGTEYFNKYPSEVALAEILGHELGHHVLGHLNIDASRQITPAEEQDADHFGMYLCELAGHKRNDYITHCEIYEKQRKSTLTKKHIQEHGTGDERIERLREQDQYLKNIKNGKYRKLAK